MYPLLLSSPPLSRSTAFFDTTSPLSPPAPLFICSATVAFEDRGLVQVTNPKGGKWTEVRVILLVLSRRE